MAITYEYFRPHIYLYKDGERFEMIELSGDTLDDYSPYPRICPVEDPYESYDEAMDACRSDYADGLYERYCDNPVIHLTREEAEECGRIIADHAQYTIWPMWAEKNGQEWSVN